MKRAFLAAVLVSLTVPIISSAQTSHDSAVFLVDVSGTVSDASAVETAKTIARDMNAKFPDYVRSAGLMTFGNARYPQLDWVLPTGAWSRSGLDGSLAGLAKGDGPTPMGAALTGVRQGIADAEGKTALIIISDGLDNGASDPVEKARALKDEFKDRLCIFTIQLGNDARGGALLNALVDAGGCGRASSAASLGSDASVQELVDFIFPPTTKYVPPPPKPEPKPVVKPMAGDADGDGVLDPDDQCPGTLKGADVDRRGCWALKNVKFDSGKWDIKPQYYGDLDNVVTVLKENPGVNIVIAGYTDSQGSEESNQELSQRRAESVMSYITDKGVSADRLSAKGYGEANPVADNATAEGRAENRRIQLKVVE